MKFKSIRMRTYVMLIPLMVASLISMSAVSYFQSKNLIENELDYKMNNQLDYVTEKIEKDLFKHSKIAETTGQIIESNNPVGQGLNYFHSVLKTALEINQQTLGVGIFFEPYKYKKETQFYSTYASRSGNAITTTEDFNNPTYDYPNQEWFKVGKDADQNYEYSEPYFDDMLKASMITTAVPFHDSNNNFLGVVTADLSIDTIQKMIQDTKVGFEGWAFLVDEDGDYLAGPDTEKVMKEKINDSKSSLYEISKVLFSNEKGNASFDYEGKNNLIYYKKVPETNWVVSLVIPKDELMAPINSLLKTQIIIGTIFTLVVILFINFFVRYINRNIKQVNELSLKLSKGDFTETMETKSEDEFGSMASNFNRMIISLRTMITEIVGHTETVSNTSDTLNRASGESRESSRKTVQIMEEVASGALMQVRGADESATAISEVSLGMQRISDSISNVHNSTVETSEKVQKGNEIVNEAIAQMSAIDSSVKEVAKFVQVLDARSKEIDQIVQAITKITEQTNLLALNAAIEAARAGEHGKGFAVVADEVRKLAEQSMDSAEQISRIITQIQSDTTSAVTYMETGTKEVKKGEEVIHEVGNVFEVIQEEFNKVSENIMEITASVEQISAGAEQVSASTEELAGIAKEASGNASKVVNASEEQLMSVENIANSANKLRELTVELKNILSAFKVK